MICPAGKIPAPRLSFCMEVRRQASSGFTWRPIAPWVSTPMSSTTWPPETIPRLDMSTFHGRPASCSTRDGTPRGQPLDPSPVALATWRVSGRALRRPCAPAWRRSTATRNCVAVCHCGAIPARLELGLPDNDLRSGDLDDHPLLVPLPCHRTAASLLDLPRHRAGYRAGGEGHNPRAHRGDIHCNPAHALPANAAKDEVPMDRRRDDTSHLGAESRLAGRQWLSHAHLHLSSGRSSLAPEPDHVGSGAESWVW